MPRYVNIDEYLKDTFCDKFDDCILEEECLECWARQHTEDVAPVIHAEWIDLYVEGASVTGCCSHCGWEVYLYDTDVVGMPYCPNCGAKMDKE